MLSYLGAELNAQTIIIYAVLIVALLAMLIMPYFTQRKKNQEYMKMLDSIKVGDLVKTAGGIIGKITKIQDKGEIKTVILETGAKGSKSTMEFDMSMVYCVLKSTKAPAEEAKTEEDTEKAEEVSEPVQEKPATEEKPKTKKTTRKVAKKD